MRAHRSRIAGACASCRLGLLQRVRGFLTTLRRLVDLTADANQKLFRTLFRDVEFMHQLAALDQREFELCERMKARRTSSKMRPLFWYPSLT